MENARKPPPQPKTLVGKDYPRWAVELHSYHSLMDVMARRFCVRLTHFSNSLLRRPISSDSAFVGDSAAMAVSPPPFNSLLGFGTGSALLQLN